MEALNRLSNPGKEFSRRAAQPHLGASTRASLARDRPLKQLVGYLRANPQRPRKETQEFVIKASRSMRLI
jgi:hypothetical protein